MEYQLSSKEGCFVEAGGDHSAYVDPLDEDELASKIDHCLSDSKMREKMIIKGLKYAKKFDPENISKQLINAYSSLL